jgi:hypothetical protein
LRIFFSFLGIFFDLALGGAEFLDVEAELSGTDASGDESDHGEVVMKKIQIIHFFTLVKF